ncbi:MAG: PEP-CTERM sorting domain-containing protein [Pirellulales bacterium]|nr:PEP-CTERM sorting domain-containing protein [Pirellulales bacterium]
MSTICTRTMAMLILGILVSLIGSQVPAVTISTDFSNTTTGEFPSDWTNIDSMGTWVVDESDELILTSASDDSTVVWDTPGTLTDFTVSATFHNGSGRAGIVGRSQDADNYYVLRIAGTTYLDLYWNTSSGYGRIAHVALDPDYVYDDMCTMSMTFDGSDISGEVRNSSDVIMGEFAISDTHIASGKVGLRANSTTFGCSEFRVDFVPEPSTVALLISALAGLLIARSKR